MGLFDDVCSRRRLPPLFSIAMICLMVDVSFDKLIMHISICFDERQKGISPLYNYHVIFGLSLKLLLFKYAMI